MITKEDIREWLNRGMKMGATHVIVVCDTFDYEDYPVFVMPGQDVHVRVDHYRNADMQTVMEVYNLNMSLEKQLKEHRSFNY